MSEVTDLARKINDGISEVAQTVRGLRERVDLVENRFEKMDLLGSGERPLPSHSEHHGIFALNDAPAAPNLSASQQNSLAAYIRTGDLHQLRAGMSVGSEPDGGFLVGPQISERVERTAFDLTVMRRFARLEKIEGADAFEEPISTTQASTGWVGETEARPETDQPELKYTRIPLHEVYASPRATQKILDLSNFKLANWLQEEVADSFSKDEDAGFTVGDGEKKPRGFLTYTTSATADSSRSWGEFEHVVSGDGTGLAAIATALDPFQDMIAALRTRYHAGAVWMGNRKTTAVIRKLKDADDRFMWQPSLQVGQPDLFMGFPWQINDQMPDIASDSLPVAFGNFRRAYIIVDWSGGIRILRDPYSTKGQVLFYTTKRVGGGAHDYNALKFLKIST